MMMMNEKEWILGTYRTFFSLTDATIRKQNEAQWVYYNRTKNIKTKKSYN